MAAQQTGAASAPKLLLLLTVRGLAIAVHADVLHPGRQRGAGEVEERLAVEVRRGEHDVHDVVVLEVVGELGVPLAGQLGHHGGFEGLRTVGKGETRCRIETACSLHATALAEMNAKTRPGRAAAGCCHYGCTRSLTDSNSL